jgi:hypothetical protein
MALAPKNVTEQQNGDKASAHEGQCRNNRATGETRYAAYPVATCAAIAQDRSKSDQNAGQGQEWQVGRNSLQRRLTVHHDPKGRGKQETDEKDQTLWE